MTYTPFKIDFEALARICEQERAESKITRITSTGGSFVEITEYRDRVWLNTSGGIVYTCTGLEDAKTTAARLVQAWDNGDYSIEDDADIKDRWVR